MYWVKQILNVFCWRCGHPCEKKIWCNILQWESNWNRAAVKSDNGKNRGGHKDIKNEVRVSKGTYFVWFLDSGFTIFSYD